MKTKTRVFIVALGLLTIFLGSCPSLAATDCDKATTDMSKADCQVLLMLYSSTNGTGWHNNAGWNVDNKPCSWYGVTCRDWHVISLKLWKNNLTGTIPPELAQLTYPEIINLCDNNLTGAIPEELGRYVDRWLSLKVLNLSYNKLTGSIPDGLGWLDNLEELWLNDNELSGHIPAPDTHVLPRLKVLALAFNHLEGSIPFEISNLKSLESLYLNSNRLIGLIPDVIDDLPNLTNIDFSYNALSGYVPDFPGTYYYGALETLNLRYNMLTASPTVTEKLNKFDSGWAATQTVPPTNLHAASPAVDTVRLTWTPILYTRDGGGYQVEYTPAAAWHMKIHGSTATKAVSSYSLSGLAPGSYYVHVCTHTPPHPPQQNDLLSYCTNPVPVVVLSESPVPILTTLSPATKPAGGPAFTLTAIGKNFVGQSVITWDGTDLNTEFVNATELRANIPAERFKEPGKVDVRVFNPPPGGGSSGPLTFSIEDIAGISMPGVFLLLLD